MKLLHLITGLGLGGAETSLLRVLECSDPSKPRPVVVSMITPGAIADPIRDLGIPVHSLDMIRGLPSLRAVYRLLRILRNERPDVVQAWMYHANLMSTVTTALSGGPPVLWGLHHSNLDPRLNKGSTLVVSRICSRLSPSSPSRIVCCARSTLEVHARAGYDLEKMTVIPNGYDLDVFRPDPRARSWLREELGYEDDTQIIGLIARHDPQKDHETFLEAARILVGEMPRVRFVLAGQDIDEGNTTLVASIRERGLEPVLSLLGPRDDVPRVAAALDVGTLSSRGEAFPNVLAETMACGVPCVSTDIGDAREILGDTGILVPAANPRALASGWRELLRSTEPERRARGELARQRIATQYSKQAIAERYAEAWNHALSSALPV